MAAEATTADKPKEHSAFTQVILRKSGEALDLGGKGLLGISGLAISSASTLRLAWTGGG